VQREKRCEKKKKKKKTAKFCFFFFLSVLVCGAMRCVDDRKNIEKIDHLYIQIKSMINVAVDNLRNQRELKRRRKEFLKKKKKKKKTQKKEKKKKKKKKEKRKNERRSSDCAGRWREPGSIFRHYIGRA
jgi:transcriptional regulator with GAF, ATPase, and Fis domain